MALGILEKAKGHTNQSKNAWSLWRIVGQGIQRLRETDILDEYLNAGKPTRWLSSKRKPPFTKMTTNKLVGEARSSLWNPALAVL